MDAGTLEQKVRVARGIAVANIIGLGGSAVLALGSGAIDGRLSLVGVALAALAWNEAAGRRGLAELDVRAPRRLCLNQLAVLAVVLAYCAWNAYGTWTAPQRLDLLLEEAPELRELMRQLDPANEGDMTLIWAWVRTATLVVFGAVAVLSVLLQGGLAWYYRSLTPVVEALAALPEALRPRE